MVVGSLFAASGFCFFSVPIRCVPHPSHMRMIIVVCSLLAILIGRCPQRGRRISLPATSSDNCHCIRLAVVQCALLDDGPMDSGQANFSEGEI